MFKNKHLAFFALIFSLIAGCKLFFTDDIQQKSAQLLDEVKNSIILNASEKKDSISNQNNTSTNQNNQTTNQNQSEDEKNLSNAIEKEQNQTPEQPKLQQQIGELIASSYITATDDTLTDQKQNIQSPIKEKENLTPIAAKNISDSTSISSKNTKEEKTISGNKLENKIPTNSLSNKTPPSSIEGSNSKPLNDSIIEYSGDYEYTYSSMPTTTFNFSYNGSVTTEKNDSPEYEYNAKLEKAEQQIKYILEMLQKIKKDKDQVSFQTAISIGSQSTSKNKEDAKKELKKFSKEKLAQTLKEIYKITDNAKTNIEDASEDYYEVESELSKNYTTKSSQNLDLVKDQLYDLTKAVESATTTYDAYIKKTTGIGYYELKSSELEKLLEEVKNLIQKAKINTKR